MKRILFAFLIVLFAGSVYGLSMNAPEEIPSNVSWSFWIEFDSLDFTEAKIFFNGTDLARLDIYHGELSVVPDSVNDGLALSVFPSNQKVFVSMAGLGSGEHSLKTEVFRDSEKIDEASATINAFESLGKEYKTELETTLQSIQDNINSFAVEINELKGTMDEVKTKVDEFTAKVGAVESNVSGFGETVSSTSSALAGIEERIGKMDGALEYLMSDVDSLRLSGQKLGDAQQGQKSVLDGLLGMFNPQPEAETIEQPAPETEGDEKETGEETGEEEDSDAGAAAGTGFAAMGGTALVWGIIIIIAVFAVLIVFNIARQRGLFERNSEEYGEVPMPTSGDLKQSIEDQRSGKWSFEGQESPKEKKSSEPSRFVLGDLIKKKQDD